MWRRLGGLVAVTLVSAVVGLATSLAVSSNSIGAATIAVPRCTNAGLTVFQNLAGGTVASVTVAGIPAACGGGSLQLTVNNGVTSASGSAVVPVGGGSATVTFGVPPAVTGSEQTDAVLVGP